MSELLSLQFKFAEDTTKLYLYIISRGLQFRYGEAWRSDQQAKRNEEHGVGIINSLHCDRLAVDLIIHYHDGEEVSREDYEDVGTYWKALDDRNCWGGDFEGKTAGDIYHFSLSYQGVK